MPAMTEREFEAEFQEFSARSENANEARFPLRWEDRKACLHDRTSTTGFDRHYVYHTAWAARVLAATRAPEHVDIGSSLFFIGGVSAFLPIKFYDYRPADLQLPGVQCLAADLLKLPFPDHSVKSLSCMHVVEHVGLGRYGDPLDPQGDLKAMAELKRVSGGNLLFVVPIGKPRVCFNAHRVYRYRQIVEAFAGLELHQFALIPEHAHDGGLLIDATEAQSDRENYACGCFWFRRAL